ncbi:GNAT family N-acetyltransferase [uncultured Jatrophihabitans sp.]|uniref:GNAT family N-acetyltransferase n=1 Tax=uncultured Jatrophihabitans sp. TaxID=1610747 RepID=UPI0035CA3083
MIAPSTGLSDQALAEIADLERRVVAADGGRLKLEWGTLRARHEDAVNDVLVHEDGRLVGFAGVYRHGGDPEITGMVDPAHRRRGLGRETLAAVLGLVHEPTALLVVPRSSAGGRALARARGATFDHAEHAMVQRTAVAVPPADVVVRPAVDADRVAVDELLRAGFGDVGGTGDRLDRTTIAERDGRVVASLVVERDAARAGVYGFVVTPELRGRGIGRAVLGEVCRELRTDGVDEVRLEVEVRNERALGLYTSLGFEPVITEDYYRVRVAG